MWWHKKPPSIQRGKKTLPFTLRKRETRSSARYKKSCSSVKEEKSRRMDMFQFGIPRLNIFTRTKVHALLTMFRGASLASCDVSVGHCSRTRSSCSEIGMWAQQTNASTPSPKVSRGNTWLRGPKDVTSQRRTYPSISTETFPFQAQFRVDIRDHQDPVTLTTR
jgi:hypothetical protein